MTRVYIKLGDKLEFRQDWFDKFKDSPVAVTVGKNEVQKVVFEQDGKEHLCIPGLNGSSAVIIFSQQAAILAHISDLPTADISEQTIDQNIKEKMEKVANLYNENRNYFTSNTSKRDCLVITPKTILLHRKSIICSALVASKLPHAFIDYVPPSSTPGIIVITRGVTPVLSSNLELFE